MNAGDLCRIREGTNVWSQGDLHHIGYLSEGDIVIYVGVFDDHIDYDVVISEKYGRVLIPHNSWLPIT